MVAQWGSKAAEVCISRTGKTLSAVSRLSADRETGAESSLQEIKAGNITMSPAGIIKKDK